MAEVDKDIKFFVEYPPENLSGTGRTRPEFLRKNILTEEVCGALAERHWGMAMATSDFSEGTTKLVQWMNKNFSDVPIVAWLVLPHEQGYWTNEENLRETDAGLGELIKWVDTNSLVISGIGFDIELPVQWSAKALKNGISGYALAVLRRRWEKLYQADKRGENPSQEFSYIVGRARGQGIPTEAYTMPKPLADILGLFEPEGVDRVFTMVYTSDLPASLARPFLEVSLRPGIYPAFGNVEPETEINPGKIIVPGRKGAYIGEEELARAVKIVKDKGAVDEFNYFQAVRIFSLTGRRTVNWVASALNQK